MPIDTSMDVDERGVGLLETGPLEIEGDDEVDFYLDCSICRRRGVNLVSDVLCLPSEVILINCMFF